jgi:hypothetical protein
MQRQVLRGSVRASRLTNSTALEPPLRAAGFSLRGLKAAWRYRKPWRCTGFSPRGFSASVAPWTVNKRYNWKENALSDAEEST